MSTVSVRIDDVLKERAETVLRDLGLNPTQGVTQFYEYLAEHGRLPFRVITRTETPEDVWLQATEKLAESIRFLRSLIRMAPDDMGNQISLSATPPALYRTSAFIRTNHDFLKLVERDVSAPAPERDAHRIWADAVFTLDGAARRIAATETGQPLPREVEASCDLLNVYQGLLTRYFEAPEAVHSAGAAQITTALQGDENE